MSNLKNKPFKLRVYLYFSLLLLPCISGTSLFAGEQRKLIELSEETSNAESTLKEIFDYVEKNSQYVFFYHPGNVDLNKKVLMDPVKHSIKEILNKLSEDPDLEYKIDKRQVNVRKKAATPATPQDSADQLQKEKIINGSVTDKAGEPVIGANIVVKGANRGTVSDVNGNFSLSAPNDAVISITYIGYFPQEVKVENKTTFKIVMEENEKMLSEVVVTALGIKRAEKSLGYAVQSVSGEALSNVKGVEVGTSLSGKIAGVNVRNSTEFNAEPNILVRGESPLIVIDGIPYSNIGLREVAADDIEDMSVLKGSTASALYGARGQSGAIMITTKRGKKEGLTVSVNSNTMFHAGYLKLPKVQTSYSTGTGGKYDREDFVWGDKMDIGRTAVQYDPYTYEWREMPLVSKGKNNFKNFLENSFVTNNNINVTYKGQKGSFRSSLTYVYNKGQYPNLELNRFTYTVAGNAQVGKFSIDGSATFNKRFFPTDKGAGYGTTGYIYNLMVWTGTDYDIRDYRDYWVRGKEDEVQNWWNPGWYNNPYFTAYERTYSQHNDRYNGHFNVDYEATKWLLLKARVGTDFYTIRSEEKTPKDTRGNAKGAYSISDSRGYSINSDLIALANYKVGDFTLDGMFGGSLYFYEDDRHDSQTSNGLTIPGFYSLSASVDPASTSSSVSKRQINGLYGKMGFSWKNAVFIEATGRNDWVSTLEKSERSYFYPSVSGSFVLSEILPMPKWLDFAKLRGSWAMTKTPAGIYEINQTYSINTDVWNNQVGASFPATIRSSAIKPEATKGFELGTSAYFMKGKLKVDVSYYEKIKYNIQRKAEISSASGFSSTLINIGEEQLRRGWEVTLIGKIIETKDLQWTAIANWARDRYYYHKIDPVFSSDKPWVAPGKRWDWMDVTDWERNSEGDIIHLNGKPQLMKYNRGGIYEFPDWVWGLSNEIHYKQFTFNFTFDGRVGGYGYNRMQQSMWQSGTHPDSDNQWRYDEVVNGEKNYVGQGVKVVSGNVKYDSYGRIVEDSRVFAPNDVAISYEDYIRSYHSWSGNKRMQNVEKMTFFKLRELSVGYNVPKSLCEKLRIKNAYLALVGQNLLIWTREFQFSDPDVNSDNLNSPSVRYIGMNLKLDF